MNGGTLPELLLVDDVNVSRQVLRQVLTSAGFKVHEAESGRKALDLAASLKPQLIVLDTELPDIGGDEVCRLLKQDPATRHIPVLQVQTEQQGTGAKRPEGEQDARPPPP